MGENVTEGTNLPPPPPLTEYEVQRAIRIQKNNEVYYALNLPVLSAGLKKAESKDKQKEKTRDGSEDYDPAQDDGSDAAGSVSPPKGKKKESKKKLVMGRGPTTRSRANVGSKTTEDGSDKEPTHHSVQPTTVANPLIEIPQADDGNGSMTAFLALRKRQQEDAKKEKEEKEKLEKERVEKKKALADASKKVVQESMSEIEEGDEEVVVPYRPRGKTRMDKVHTRSFEQRIVIGMNELGQPITENDKVLSELSSFLGTLAKRCVPLTYVTWRKVPKNLKETMWNYVKARYIIPDELESWAIETIHASWRGYKCRTKAAHYTAFETDEIRLQNRPDDIPLERFKLLLEYWNDESIQDKARKNSNSRKSYTETHTLGPKSIAQLRHKMKKNAPDESEPCDAEVFVKTRTRDAGRKYKTSTKTMEKKIDKINKKINSGEAADEMLLDKEHGPTWLLGRCKKPQKLSAAAPTDTYVKELTTKIKEGLAAEVEEKVKKIQEEVDEQVNRKVQQNLASVLKKLGEANPNITIDVTELCAHVASDNDDGTPMTKGTSF
ncbi:uncharacterized protein LOC108225480 isoform X2 [Daucus carota subsp. sativus]|uniref:uncharacterized protein LOC108225480 isoform X2 n=2 Tax=Daucus carota subsp. sativus TaxID=79200 RepID=UPI0030831CEA